MSITRELITVNNLQFILVDMLEMVTKMYEHQLRLTGRTMNNKMKDRYKNMLTFIKEYLVDVKKMDLDKQTDFGEDSDYLLEAILLIMDRSGDSFKITEDIIHDIRNRESLLKLNLKQTK